MGLYASWVVINQGFFMIAKCNDIKFINNPFKIKELKKKFDEHAGRFMDKAHAEASVME